MESILQVNITDTDVLTLPSVITPMSVICVFVKVDMKGMESTVQVNIISMRLRRKRIHFIVLNERFAIQN